MTGPKRSLCHCHLSRKIVPSSEILITFIRCVLRTAIWTSTWASKARNTWWQLRPPCVCVKCRDMCLSKSGLLPPEKKACISNSLACSLQNLEIPPHHGWRGDQGYWAVAQRELSNLFKLLNNMSSFMKKVMKTAEFQTIVCKVCLLNLVMN